MFSRRWGLLKVRAGVFYLMMVQLVLVSSGCGLNFGEKKKSPTAVKLDSNEFNCLSQIGEKIDGYFSAEMSAAEIRQFYSCLGGAFEKFQRFTRGAESSSYSGQELRLFLEKEFLYPRKIEDGLLEQSMNLKQALLGGTTDKITREELQKLNLILRRLEQASLEMRTMVGPLNPSVARRSYPDYALRLQKAKESGAAVSLIAGTLGKQLESLVRPYSLQHIGGFLVELTRFIYGEGEKLERVKSWARLIETVKPILVGGSREFVEPENWGAFLESSASWYSTFLRSRYQTSDFTGSEGSIWYGPGLKDFVSNIKNGLGMAEDSVNRQPNEVIRFSDLEDLFSCLKNLDLVPRQITSQAVGKVLPPVMNKVFGDINLNPSIRNEGGLSASVLKRASEEFERWSYIQLLLDEKLSPDKQDMDPEAFAETLNVLSSGNHLYAFPNRGFKTSLSGNNFVPGKLVAGEFESIINDVRTVFKQGEGRTFLTYKNDLDDKVKKGFHNLSVMNVVRAMMRLLVRGYSTDVERSSKMMGLEQEELSRFFHDIDWLGRDIKLVDQRNVDSLGRRVFTEGNVFTYLGNGLQKPSPTDKVQALLNFKEGMELISLVFSGSNLSNQMYQEALENCEHAYLDIFGRPKVKRECFNRLFLSTSRMERWFEQLPKMKDYWVALSPSDKGLFVDTLSRIAVRPIQEEIEYDLLTKQILGDSVYFRKCESPTVLERIFRSRKASLEFEKCQNDNSRRLELVEEAVASLESVGMSMSNCEWSGKTEVSLGYCDWVEQGEMATMAVIVHYVETVLTRFDRQVPEDGRLKTEEAWEAFAVFRGLIDMMAEKAVGRSLSENELRDVYAFILTNGRIPSEDDLRWSMTRLMNTWNINLDRLGLLRIFEIIVRSSVYPPSVFKELMKFRAQGQAPFESENKEGSYEYDFGNMGP